MTISVNPHGGWVGVREIGYHTPDSDLKGLVSQYEVKRVSFNPDSIETCSTLK